MRLTVSFYRRRYQTRRDDGHDGGGYPVLHHHGVAGDQLFTVVIMMRYSIDDKIGRFNE